MKKVIIILAALLVACSGSDDSISTSVAMTVEARPTETPVPTDTSTPSPTNTPEPTDTPTPEPLPAAFLTQLQNFLEEGSALTGATTTGVTYVEFGRLLGRARGAYDLALAARPPIVPRGSMDDFDQAFVGWSLVADLWELDLGDYDNPVEPDINGYLDYLDYAADGLLLTPHPDDYIVPDYRGKLYLPFDENISILMTIAADYFEAGRGEMLLLIE